MFYDPKRATCELDVQPSTWVEFSDSLEASPALEREVGRNGRALVRFEGQLVGPGAVPTENVSDPVMVDYARRIQNRRYGHMNSYRTKLIVENVHEVRSVPKDEPPLGEWSKPRARSPLPVLVAGDLPLYPRAAQVAGIEGAVVIRVSVSSGAVSSAVLKRGDRILGASAIEAVRTWKFEPESTAEFDSHFVFDLRLLRTDEDKNLGLDLELPRFARITGPLNGW